MTESRPSATAADPRFLPRSRAKPTRTMLALGLVGWLCAPAGAVDCKDGGATQGEMTECAGLSFKKADVELNARYAKLSACLGPSSEDGTMLLDAQRAWLKFRDAECRFQSSGSEGGTVRPMLVAGCMEKLTRDRDGELNRYLTCEEGDLSCPTSRCSAATKPPHR